MFGFCQSPAGCRRAPSIRPVRHHLLERPPVFACVGFDAPASPKPGPHPFRLSPFVPSVSAVALHYARRGTSQRSLVSRNKACKKCRLGSVPRSPPTTPRAPGDEGKHLCFQFPDKDFFVVRAWVVPLPAPVLPLFLPWSPVDPEHFISAPVTAVRTVGLAGPSDSPPHLTEESWPRIPFIRGRIVGIPAGFVFFLLAPTFESFRAPRTPTCPSRPPGSRMKAVRSRVGNQQPESGAER